MNGDRIIEQLRAQTDRPRRPPRHGGSMLLAALEALQEIARGDHDPQQVAEHALRLIVRQSRMR